MKKYGKIRIRKQEETLMKLGELLKEKREQRNLTLRQVENKLKGKNINYSHTSIKRLENEEHEKVPIRVLSALAEIFNLDKIDSNSFIK